MMMDPEDRYYVVQTKPQKELLAAQEIQNQGFETFLPLIKHLPRMRRGKFLEARLSPLFPKYLFVQFNPTYDQWRSLNGTRGVIRVMCMDEHRPSPVPILTMSSLLQTGGLIEEEKAGLPFNPGDTVEFVEGSLKGVQGIVRLCTADRVGLLLNLLGRQVLTQSSPRFLKFVPSAMP